MRFPVISALILSATTLAAQGAPATHAAQTTRATQAATVSPGMSRDEVVSALGQPLSAHSYGGHTYLLYANGCERTCGMNDVVTLDSGRVVDAIFRSASRHYTGTSSSPRMIPATVARRGSSAAPVPKRAPATRAPATKAPATKPPATKAPVTKKPDPKKPDPKKPIIH
jgi:hypothetical protein